MATRRLAWLALLCVPATASALSDDYDAVCDEIVSNAKQAAASHNRGDDDGERRATRAAFTAFERAVSLQPTGAQAYFHMGTFMHNTQRFDEAVVAFEHTRPLVSAIRSRPPSGGDWSAFVDAKVIASKIGRAAVRRDHAYQNGQGNLTAALAAALEQVALSPNAPHFLFEAGTLHTVLRQRGELREQPTPPPEVTLLERAHEAAASAAVAFFRRDREQQQRRRQQQQQQQQQQGRRGRGGDRAYGSPPCPTSARLLGPLKLAQMVGGSSLDHRASVAIAEGVEHASERYGQYIAWAPWIVTVRGRSGLHGRDGVPLAIDESTCEALIFGSASWPFLALHESLWLSDEA